jgi:hypothetical protein
MGTYIREASEFAKNHAALETRSVKASSDATTGKKQIALIFQCDRTSARQNEVS